MKATPEFKIAFADEVSAVFIYELPAKSEVQRIFTQVGEVTELPKEITWPVDHFTPPDGYIDAIVACLNKVEFFKKIFNLRAVEQTLVFGLSSEFETASDEEVKFALDILDEVLVSLAMSDANTFKWPDLASENGPGWAHHKLDLIAAQAEINGWAAA